MRQNRDERVTAKLGVIVGALGNHWRPVFTMRLSKVGRVAAKLGVIVGAFKEPGVSEQGFFHFGSRCHSGAAGSPWWSEDTSFSLAEGGMFLPYFGFTVVGKLGQSRLSVCSLRHE